MELGFNKILLSIIIAGLTVFALDAAMDGVDPSVAVDYLRNLAYATAPFIAVAIYLRTKLSDLAEHEALSLYEGRKLGLILAVRRTRITIFTISCILAVVLFGLSPFLKSIPPSYLDILIKAMIVVFVELFYFFALILLTLHEAEKFKDKLYQREKADKQRQELLQKMSKQ